MSNGGNHTIIADDNRLTPYLCSTLVVSVVLLPPSMSESPNGGQKHWDLTSDHSSIGKDVKSYMQTQHGLPQCKGHVEIEIINTWPLSPPPYLSTSFLLPPSPLLLSPVTTNLRFVKKNESMNDETQNRNNCKSLNCCKNVSHEEERKS